MTHDPDTLRICLRYFDALNNRDWDGLDAILGRNVVFSVVPYGMQVRGALQVVTGSRMQGTELPDFHTEVVNAFAAGDRGTVETLTSYTLTAPWNPGVPGFQPIMPTGRGVSRPGCFMFALRGGRIMRITHYHDRLTTIRQLRERGD